MMTKTAFKFFMYLHSGIISRHIPLFCIQNCQQICTFFIALHLSSLCVDAINTYSPLFEYV